MPTLHIQLFGHFQLMLDDQPITTITRARLQSLLAYLIVERKSAHARSRIAYLFWPETTDKQAQTNLRKLLSDLRKLFPRLDDYLYIDDHVLYWRNNAPFTLDVDAFETALQRAEQTEDTDTPTRISLALKEAIALYTDDLLPELWDDWILLKREELRDAFCFALKWLIKLTQNEQEYAAAIYYAQRLVRYDPLSEPAYHQLIELYLLTNDRANALRVYQTCKELLQRELAVEPGPAIEHLIGPLRVHKPSSKR